MLSLALARHLHSPTVWRSFRTAEVMACASGTACVFFAWTSVGEISRT